MNTALAPLWISLKTSLTATLFTFFIGILIAKFMFEYHGRGKLLLDWFFTLPLLLPPTVVGFLLLIAFGKYSPLGNLLQAYGISLIFTWPATVIAATVVSFPIMYKITKASFEQINPTILQAARTLGANDWRIFRQVILPVAYPGIGAGIVLSFARALGEFGATMMIAGNIPGITQTIPLAIYFEAEGGQLDKAWFWVFIIMLLSCIFNIALYYWHKSYNH